MGLTAMDGELTYKKNVHYSSIVFVQDSRLYDNTGTPISGEYSFLNGLQSLTGRKCITMCWPAMGLNPREGVAPKHNIFKAENTGPAATHNSCIHYSILERRVWGWWPLRIHVSITLL